MKLHPALSLLLVPASWLYRLAVTVWDFSYRVGLAPQGRLKGVVISVGNLTVGGTGKTPLVMCLAQRLSDRGKSVGILSRGYRGRAATESGTGRTYGENEPSIILSDETWMMQRELGGKARLGIGANRWEHGIALQREGIDWFILDDGFQHRRLARDVDIVVVDSTNPFGNGRFLPAGPLREPLSALARTDVVIITRDGDSDSVERTVRAHTEAPIFRAMTDLKEVAPSRETFEPGEPAAWLGKRMFAFCAIGNSDAFFRDVQRWGMSVVGHSAFPDHHRYARADVLKLEQLAREAGAEALLCTDKDTYNLQEHKFNSLPLYVCRMTLRFADEKKFWDTLYEIIEKKKAQRTS